MTEEAATFETENSASGDREAQAERLVANFMRGELTNGIPYVREDDATDLALLVVDAKAVLERGPSGDDLRLMIRVIGGVSETAESLIKKIHAWDAQRRIACDAIKKAMEVK